MINNEVRRAMTEAHPHSHARCPVEDLPKYLSEASRSGRSIIVDFDETLWLRNSTEEYLDAVRPRNLAFLILAAVDIAKPWRFSASPIRERVYRDWLRVLIVSCLFPWSLYNWRRRAKTLARQWLNQDLFEMATNNDGSQLYVATFGFAPIVKPLLVQIYPNANLVAGSLGAGYKMRQSGKKAAFDRQFGSDFVANAIVITDSEDDSDLLSACYRGFLVEWPKALYRPAFSDCFVRVRRAVRTLFQSSRM